MPKPTFWMTLLVVVVVTILAAIGWWQLQRKRNKRKSQLRFYRVRDKGVTISANQWPEKGDGIGDATSMVSLPITTAGTSAPYHIVTQREGSVLLLRNGQVLRELLSAKQDLPGFTDSGMEAGMMGAVVHPEFPAQPYMYLSYTTASKHPSSAIDLVVVRCRVPDATQPGWQLTGQNEGDRVELFRQGFRENYHHAGTLAFDTSRQPPALYLSTGDGGPQGDPDNAAQNPDNYLGKLLRLELDREPAIVALGLRNPWKFCIDSGVAYVADVGLSTSESLYRLPDLYPEKPYNLGWAEWEGSAPHRQPPAESLDFYWPPIFEYPYGEKTGRATCGGFPLADGARFVLSDFSGLIRVLEPVDAANPEGPWQEIGQSRLPDNERIYSLAEGPELYALGSTHIWRLLVVD